MDCCGYISKASSDTLSLQVLYIVGIKYFMMATLKYVVYAPMVSICGLPGK